MQGRRPKQWKNDARKPRHFSVSKATDFFQAERSVRQGHPLSPFLFLIILEVLVISLKKEVFYGNVKGLHIIGSIPNLTHMQFMDKTIFLGKLW